jgi:O-antigen/teichoic acid export membrane protein
VTTPNAGEGPKAEAAGGVSSVHREAVRTSVANASKLTLAMAITIPLGFVGRILIPRFLGSEQAGLLFFAEGFPVLLLTFLPLGIPAYIQKTVPPRHEHAAEIFSPILRIQLLLGLALSLVLIGFMRATNYPTLVIVLTGIMAIYQTLWMLTTEIMQPLFLAIGQINFTTALNVGAKVMVTGSILVCLFMGGGPMTLAWVFLATQSVIVGIVIAKARRLGLAAKGDDVAKMWPVLWMSLPFFAGTVLTRTSGSVDIAILSRLGSFHEVGYYGAVQRLHGLFMMLVPIVQNALMPVLSRAYGNDEGHYDRLAGSAARALCILAFPLSIGMTIFSREIVGIVYGAEFLPAARVLMVNGPLLLLSYVTVFIAMNVVITTNGRSMALALAGTFVLNAILDLVFIPLGMHHLGAGGGAAGALASTLVVEIVTVIALIRTAKTRAFGGRTLFTFVVAAFPSLALVVFADRWSTVDLTVRIAAFVIGVPAYFFLSRMASIAELVTFANILRKKPVAVGGA